MTPPKKKSKRPDKNADDPASRRAFKKWYREEWKSINIVKFITMICSEGGVFCTAECKDESISATVLASSEIDAMLAALSQLYALIDLKRRRR